MRYFHSLRSAPVLLLLGVLAACSEAGEGHLFQVESTGVVSGDAFLDLGRTGTRAAGDPSLAGLELALVMFGSRDTVALAQSDTAGFFGARELPLGSFLIVPDPGFLGDSLEVTRISPSPAEVRRGPGTEISVGISFPIREVEEILEGPTGVRLYARGIALNSRGSLPGSAVHIRSGDRALRVVDVAPLVVQPGDSILILGRTQRPAGRVILEEGLGRLLRQGVAAPAPWEITTIQAASAAGGGRNDDLVMVTGVEVLDVRSSFGEIVATVSDGSGPVVVRFPSGYLTELRVEALEPGTVFDVQGILLRAGSGTSWELRPRVPTDLMGLEPAP